MTAENPLEATRMLRKEGKVVVSLHEDIHETTRYPKRGGRVRQEDVIYFATQLAVMVDTGVPLSEALDAAAEQSENRAMASLVGNLSKQVKAGVPFSEALAAYPRAFSGLFVALMRASEASGTMGAMLQRVSEHMELQRDIRNRIRGALTYPVCMLGFCVIVVVALMIFILPRFANIYAGKGVLLPLPTRILMGVSGGLVEHWLAVIVGLIACILAGWFYFDSPRGKRFLDDLRLRIPVVGKMYRRSYLARSLRTMATMVSTGVSMLDGLEITAQAAGNYNYAKIWLDLAENIRQGGMLSEQLYHCKLIPNTVSQMIAAGEKTGKLAVVMDRVARFCETELRISIKTVTSLIEPATIVVMGVIVGGIALALLLPIFSMSKVVAQ